MQVSVIVPIYGVEKYIAKCANSLFEQTFEDIEYIFVDDASPDQSVQVLQNILQKFPSRINQVRILRHQCNKGLAEARKTGILAAQGKYLLHVDSDDWLEKTAVKELYDTAEQANADIVVFDLKHVYKNRCVQEHNSIASTKLEYIKKILRRETSVNLVTKFFKTEICKRQDVLPIDGLNYSEDFSVLPRVVYYAENIVKLDQALYYYNHLNEQSYTNTVGKQNLQSLMKSLQLHQQFFASKADWDYYKRDVLLSEVINKNIMLGICADEDISYVLSQISFVGYKLFSSLSIKHKIFHLMGVLNMRTAIKWYRTLKKKYIS